jgi:3D (Asp-Asp-Asp) domain-containing protein
LAHERRETLERDGDARLVLAAIGFVSLAACSTTAAVAPTRALPVTLQTVAEHRLDAPDLSGRKQLTLWATFYSIPRVHAVERGGHELLDSGGRALGPSLSTRDFCDAAMEGTVLIRFHGRWRTYNYAGTGPDVQVDCSDRYPKHRAIGRSRFRVSNIPFGEGASGASLVPFRTIAVDPRFIPYGTVLFIPSARGRLVELRGGEKRTHDGYFFAGDTGGSIDGPHIDVFLGIRGENPFTFIGSSARKTFDAYVIDDPDLRHVFDEAHELHSKKNG